MSNFRALLCAFSVVSVASAFAVGCGSSPDAEPGTSETGTSEPGTSEPAAEHGAYAHCLSQNGVDEPPPPALGPGPGPGVPPAGVDNAAWEQALQDCASLAPGPPGP